MSTKRHGYIRITTEESSMRGRMGGNFEMRLLGKAQVHSGTAAARRAAGE
jgi:hypothetical protein